MKRHEMVEDMLKWGWPIERLSEIEYPPEHGGIGYIELKKLWLEWKRGERRLELAQALGAEDKEQAKEVVRWAGTAMDTVRKAALRAGVTIGAKSELLRTSATIMAGILSCPGEDKDHPTEIAKRAVSYALALLVEVDEEVERQKTVDKGSDEGGQSGTD